MKKILIPCLVLLLLVIISKQSVSTVAGYGGHSHMVPTVPTIITVSTSTANEINQIFDTPATSSLFYFNNYLARGMVHDDVRELQIRLAQEGCYDGDSFVTTFGPLTEAAVICYQRMKNIQPQSGVVGTRTRAALNSEGNIYLSQFVDYLARTGVIPPDKIELAGEFLATSSPITQETEQRNLQRRYDILTILSAIYQYSKEDDISALKLKSENKCSTSSLDAMNLQLLSPNYITAIPVDPMFGVPDFSSGYYVNKNITGRITVCAPNAENGMSIGVTR